MEWLVAVGLLVIGYLLFRKPKKEPRKTHEKPNLQVLPKQFAVFDLETTGLNPSKHEIIEIGAVKVNRDSNKHITFQSLVKPSKKIPKKITEITGITQKMVDTDGEELESILQQFDEFIGDLRLVAFNADFDMGFFKGGM
jgi:DNA polymerase III epsilon subunit family exonuclease